MGGETLTVAAVQERLDALHDRLTEAGHRDVEVALHIIGRDRFYARIMPRASGANGFKFSDDPMECLNAIEAGAAALPDPKTQRQQKAIAALLKAAEEARDAELPDAFVNPIFEKARAMAEAAIAHLRKPAQ